MLKTTLAMFAGPYEYTETTIITQVGQALFKSVGKSNQSWLATPIQDKIS
nr:hypothetical protein [Lactiplantibacillus plantarum]